MGAEQVQCRFTDGGNLGAIERAETRRPGDAHIQHLNTMLQQSAFQAQPSGTPVPQPDLHREMLARVKEFDGDDDKWPGWWFTLQSLLKANHLGYEGMIERIVHETDSTNLNNAVLSSADQKLSSSLYYVLGLTMTDESKSLKIVRNGAVGEGASCSSQVVGGVSARHRRSSQGSADVNHELVGSCDRSRHCNHRAGFENHCLGVTER